MPDAPANSDTHRPDRTRPQSTEAGRRRGRVLIPGVILGVILAIFAVLLLITRCGSAADDVGQGDASGAVSVVTADGLVLRV
jgi:hypothetical protein